jgi:hypothetical protein
MSNGIASHDVKLCERRVSWALHIFGRALGGSGAGRRTSDRGQQVREAHSELTEGPYWARCSTARTFDRMPMAAVTRPRSR